MDRDRIWALAALARNLLHMYGSAGAILIKHAPDSTEADLEQHVAEIETMDHLISDLEGGDGDACVCAFCGRDRDHVGRLVAAEGGVAICDACVAECVRLIQGAES
jgi:hypothetical protein